MVLGLLAHVMPSIFFSRIVRSDALVYNWYFFSEQPFYGNYSTLDSHTNTVIFHAFAYSSRGRRKPWQGPWMIFFTPVIVKHMKKNLDTRNLIRANKFSQSLGPSLYRGSTVLKCILGSYHLQMRFWCSLYSSRYWSWW